MSMHDVERCVRNETSNFSPVLWWGKFVDVAHEALNDSEFRNLFAVDFFFLNDWLRSSAFILITGKFS